MIVRRTHAVAAVAAVLSGCFDPQIQEGLACGPQLICPAGQVCDPFDGRCRVTPVGDRADADVDDFFPRADAAPAAVIRIDELSTVGADEDDPSLTGDELEIFFNYANATVADIYTATRASRDEPWSAPAPVVELNSAAADTTPWVSRDGLSIYLSSARGGTAVQLYFATRATRTSAWSTPTLIAELASPQNDVNPTVTADGLTLIVSRGLQVGNLTPVQSRRPSTASPWGAPVPLTEIDGLGLDTVALSFDGLTGVISSDRAGAPGTLPDLFVARRSGVDAGFGLPLGLDIVNTAADEGDPWIAEDRDRLYFSSTRDGDRDLYVLTHAGL